MSSSSQAPVQVIRFGVFEANLRSGELRKSGIKIKLHDQPFQILTMLLERPGELVTRDEIRKKLWPGETFVDFDHGLNNAVNRLREALGDSAESPRFVETLPRRGYRFIAAVDPQHIAAVDQQQTDRFIVDSGSVPATLSVEVPRRKSRWLPYAAGALTIAAILTASLGVMKFRGDRTAPPAIRSLAVLPLENLSGDPTQDYFADGMTDALITQLARIGSLRITSRMSAMTYKNTRKTLREIARELDVDAVIEGTVVRSGNRVRISAKLIQVSPERHLWAEAYEQDIADIVVLQNDMARAIADEVQVRLTPEEQRHVAVGQNVDPKAYDAYLMGRYFLDRAGKDNLLQAANYYQQALQLDPNYAPAWAGLAETYRFLGGGGHMPEQEAETKARAAVLRAIELDPNLADAHAAIGSIQTFVDWDWTAADTSFRRALALEPGNVSALRGAAFLAQISGRLDDALWLARRAVERDPMNPRSHRLAGGIATCAGRLDEATASLNRSIQLNPEGIYAHTDLAWVYLEQSRPREALAEVEHEKAEERYFLGLAVTYHALGRKGESDAALSKLIQKHADDSGLQIAQAYAFRGETDQAFKWLERAYKQRDGALVTVKEDPLLKSLHADPRYSAFLQKMRLPS